MTTNFFVLQAQRDLNQARNNELQALIDYLKSVVDYETAQMAPLGGGNGVTVSTTGGGNANHRPATAAAATAPALAARQPLDGAAPEQPLLHARAQIAAPCRS